MHKYYVKIIHGKVYGEGIVLGETSAEKLYLTSSQSDTQVFSFSHLNKIQSVCFVIQ